MRSLFAKNLEAIRDGSAAGEDCQFIPAETLTGSIVKADLEKLKEFEPIAVQVAQDLDSIVCRNDAAGLVKVAEVIAPYRKIAEKYDDGIPFARISIGKRLPLVKTACDSLDKAIASVTGELYAKFDDWQRAIANINDLPKEISTVIGIRNEVDSIAESYKVLSDRFSSKVSKPEIDNYLKVMPGIAKVRKELGEIASMLEQDQSGNGFVDLKRKRKDVDGIIFAGRLKKEACRLNYKEGVVMCSELKKQIDQYIREFPKVQQAMSWIEQMHTPVEQIVSRLESISEPDESSAKVLQIAQNLLFIKGLPQKPAYSFLNSRYERLSEMICEVKKLYEEKGDLLFEMAKKAFGSVKIPEEPSSVEELDHSLDTIQAAMPKVSSYKAVFSALSKPSEAEDCEIMYSKLKMEYYKRIEEKKKHSELSDEVKGIVARQKEIDSLFTDPSFVEFDSKKIMELFTLPSLEIPKGRLFAALKDSYQNALIDYGRKVNAKAAYALDKMTEFYSQPVLQTSDPSADAIAVQSRISRISAVVLPELKKTFAKVPTQVYEARLKTALQGFTAQLTRIHDAVEQRNDLSVKIRQIQTALQNMDWDAISCYSKWPADSSSSPYVEELAKKYSSLVQHLQGIAPPQKQQAYVSNIMGPHESFRTARFINNKRFNFFSYLHRSLSEPKSQYLIDLRKGLLNGTVDERLAILESSLKNFAETPLGPDDMRWLSQVKSAYTRDIAEGYLANSEEFQVSKGRIESIKKLFDKNIA
jgi:hypothetical protein